MKQNSVNNTKKSAKIGNKILRVGIFVLAFCLLTVGFFIISDYISGDNSSPEPEIIVITVSDENIMINDDETVTFEGLKVYLKQADEKGELYTVALINDTASPADAVVYNQVVDLLKEFGIECEKMDISSTLDESATAVA